jgi:hypothetical protein
MLPVSEAASSQTVDETGEATTQSDAMASFWPDVSADVIVSCVIAGVPDEWLPVTRKRRG